MGQGRAKIGPPVLTRRHVVTFQLNVCLPLAAVVTVAAGSFLLSLTPRRLLGTPDSNISAKSVKCQVPGAHVGSGVALCGLPTRGSYIYIAVNHSHHIIRTRLLPYLCLSRYLRIPNAGLNQAPSKVPLAFSLLLPSYAFPTCTIIPLSEKCL
ncbi:hypothetical protein F4781DRAFT_189208 [Annulohypoxylon bovei var. microspora]|nr:hypothetical protein F4781DRAFT_189208 [Annulohypoxylon bovei var. microspora]